MRKSQILGILVLPVLFAFPARAPAQILDAQALMGQALNPGLSGELTFSAHLRSGNSELWSLSGAPHVRYLAEPHRFLLTISGEFGESQGQRSVNQWATHLRYRYPLNERWDLEAFSQAQFDEFRRLDLRLLLGGGTRRSLDLGLDDAAVGLAIMAEDEHLEGSVPGADPSLDATLLRASLYLTASHAVSDGWSLSSTTYAQPSIVGGGALRLTSSSSVEAQPAGRVAILVGFSVAYDHSPPADVKSTDVLLETGLKIDF